MSATLAVSAPPATRSTPYMVTGLVVSAIATVLYTRGGDWEMIGLGLAGVTGLWLTLVDVKFGLMIFLLLSGLSPEVRGGGNYGAGDLRIEDFFFPVILLGWAVSALRRGWRFSWRTPLTAPMVAITLWGLAVTALGLMEGTVPHGSTAFYRWAKYTEYYFIFFLAFNSVRNFDDARELLMVFIAAAAVTAIYSSYRGATNWRQEDLGFARASGPTGENYNTLSGYLLEALSMALALGLSSRGRNWRIGLGAAALILTGGILYTHSREGYVMLVSVVVFLASRRYRGLVITAGMIWWLAPIILPSSVRFYAFDTVHQLQTAPNDDPGSNSMTARLWAWRWRWNEWFVKQPIQGHGIGAIAFSVDNTYLLTMCETGLIGLGLFLWLLWRLWLVASRVTKAWPDTFPGVLCLGLMGALVGLLVQGWAAVSFGTIRTMEPFWLIVGLTFAVVHMATTQTAGIVAAGSGSQAPVNR